jgi:hypothetical protein
MTLVEWVILFAAIQLSGLIFLAYVGCVAKWLGIEVEEIGVGIGMDTPCLNGERAGRATSSTGFQSRSWNMLGLQIPTKRMSRL